MNVTSSVANTTLDVTSLEARKMITFVLSVVLEPPLLMVGLVTNLLTVGVFTKIGLRDSISPSFFLLSCSDLVCVLFMIPSDFFILFSKSVPESWRVDGETLTTLLMFYYPMFFDISQLITTLIAVQRCWCVALPFRFKGTFTRRKTSGIVLVIVIVSIGQYIPVLVSQGLTERRDPSRNKTVLIFWTSEIRGQVYHGRGIFALVMTTTCQLTVIVCLVILTASLRTSARFRKSVGSALSDKSSTCKGNEVKNNAELSKPSLRRQWSIDSENKQLEYALENGHENTTQSVELSVRNTSRKEVQAIKSTTFVSIIFILCNTPRLLMYYIVICVPEFNLQSRYEHSYVVGNSFRFFFEAINASFNIFVYLKFNSRFRSTLKSSC